MKKVLIANRGEIAVRIIRACHDLGLSTVAIYSKADEEALHTLLADEAICIGDSPSKESYLKISNILSACEITNADTIHPGYGFLSENAKFAAICESCKITFIGPSSKSILKLGDKSKAKEIAKKVKCPVIQGTDGAVKDIDHALIEARKIGFPIFIKASAGGGGKGIRTAYSEPEFIKNFISAKTEAEASFNNSDIYLEKMIKNPRHIEVQILADKFGNIIHLGERDCSIQRRRQKLIEEAPSPKISSPLRKKITQCAINIIEEANYYSAATVEFLIDEKNNFYFMEVNTRLQVEHAISEELTGIDIVKQQFKIAMDKRITIKQKDIKFKNHVFEFRINAEDPANNFAPSPGKLIDYIPPGGPNVRLDSACYSGYVIPPFYDSMIAKLIIKARDRQEAISIAKRALKEFHITGVNSTIGFHLFILEDENFVNGNYNLNYIDDLILKGIKFRLN
ncbi:MAG: acetyl-CoA carboxylase biotin carboxylase subunit [Chlamydiae bacterium RIFCSPHIGHO2_12_FULL_27_8]|nr:MAG: acetyl-CoA carboxylase biotin carboxylase subunit [Chlamydiae bacterium RIFCSPHIGHO2_12_FULL_27_8]OGN66625.1 MAG: acetyl-CoA carboxylase biotin carboxylase subunit [Chlamydiae bacterium RIFCSPLOWO2_01_FULL_28_7]